MSVEHIGWNELKARNIVPFYGFAEYCGRTQEDFNMRSSDEQNGILLRQVLLGVYFFASALWFGELAVSGIDKLFS